MEVVMKSLRWTLAGYVVIAGTACGAPAISSHASEGEGVERGACEATVNAHGSKPTALTNEEISSKLAAKGYTQVRLLGHEDGCIEAKGLDKDGKRFEVHVSPTTGEIIGPR